MVDPEITLTTLHDFCADRLGPRVATRFVGLARPGFALTEAEPGQAAGHSRFGGRALLEPGTPWPTCDGFPLSLLAVLDADVLAPWLGDLLPAGTGLLNFFALDSDSEQGDPAAHEVALAHHSTDPRVGRVIAARAAHAVETRAPARSSVFEPVPWAASPGFSLPDAFDPAWDSLARSPGAEHLDSYDIRTALSDWPEQPGALCADDTAFGRPVFPTGSYPTVPEGEDPNRYHHLLQLSDHHEWSIGGEGGWMHWSIPTDALRAGDFGRAIPTPDHW
ncbi:DUF1963 domain-containing protein [Streptomyces sp. NPDC127098]|uniref:DUF1963 domain-containing protein n=1 Tax=Streptomyces sp. NPDC127098 TaxID=3347137 RepID=UPI00366106C7